MAETVVNFNINIRSSHLPGRASSYRPHAVLKEIDKQGFTAFNYAISDIAFKATKAQQRMVQNQLEQKFHGIAMVELRNMGRKISSLAIGLGGQHKYPPGSLEITGPVSEVLRRTDPQRVQPMQIRAVTGGWRERTKEYLQRKSKKYGHRKWWLNTGDLRTALANPQLYIGAYGPIRVMWTPERVERRFTEGSSVMRYSTLARGQGRSYTITSGHIKMSVLGRITRQMLNNPGEYTYDSRFNGLLGMLPEDVEKKLYGHDNNPYRALLEPFLTFYLNRQIPNRIFYALTQKIGKTPSIISR
jgi:hypothetical protein